MPDMRVTQGMVEVQADVCGRDEHNGRHVVGMIAIAAPQHGWVEMYPDEARRIAEWLNRAADEVDKLNGVSA